jgi:hypothetical protein
MKDVKEAITAHREEWTRVVASLSTIALSHRVVTW